MAQFLEINKGNFNRLLDLADLPKPILEAYADIRDLKVHHGAAYKNLMADSAAKRKNQWGLTWSDPIDCSG